MFDETNLFQDFKYFAKRELNGYKHMGTITVNTLKANQRKY